MPNKKKNVMDLSNAYNWPVYYRELGYFIQRQEEYERCLHFFNRSLLRDPDNIRALHGRCVARAKCCKIIGAYEDIKHVLNIEPNYIKTQAMKAYVTYLNCDFEEALVKNYRLVNENFKPDNFVMGYNCDGILRNCVGEEAGRPLRDHYSIIRKLAWESSLAKHKPPIPQSKFKKTKKLKAANSFKEKKMMSLKNKLLNTAEEKDKENKEVGDDRNTLQLGKNTKSFSFGNASIGKMSAVDSRPDSKRSFTPSMLRSLMGSGGSSIQESLNSHASSFDEFLLTTSYSFPYKPLQKLTKNLNNYMAEKYLEKMCLDKFYLKELKNNPNILICDKTCSNKILQLATVGYRNICHKQEILRHRKPFYSVKYQEMKSVSRLKKLNCQSKEIELQQTVAEQWVKNIIEKIVKSIETHEIKGFFDGVEKLHTFCHKTDKNILPLKYKYLDDMCELTLNAFYNQLKFKPYMTTMVQKQTRVKILLGLPVKKMEHQDSFFVKMSSYIIDWGKKIMKFKDRLQISKSDYEIAWLYYQLAMCSIEYKQYDMAKIYAKKAVTQSSNLKKMKWVVCCMFLLIKINLMTKNVYDAKNTLNHAKKIVRTIDTNDEHVPEFLTVCLDQIERSTGQENLKERTLKNRENAIIQILQTQSMKDEMALLFRKIKSLPGKRRMSVLPGVDRGEMELDEKKPEELKSTTEEIDAKQTEPKTQTRKHSVKFLTGVTKFPKKKRKQERREGIHFLELIQNYMDSIDFA